TNHGQESLDTTPRFPSWTSVRRALDQFPPDLNPAHETVAMRYRERELEGTLRAARTSNRRLETECGRLLVCDYCVIWTRVSLLPLMFCYRRTDLLLHGEYLRTPRCLVGRVGNGQFMLSHSKGDPPNAITQLSGRESVPKRGSVGSALRTIMSE